MKTLEARNLNVGYGAVSVVHDLELEVNAGEVVALLGANGAGKTTTMLALSGVLPVQGGEVLIDGTATRAPIFRRARKGLAFVTEERSVFMGLSSRDNLRVCGVDPDAVVAMFPELEPRMSVRAGLLSGGEQQMLTVGRALARRPSLLLADELSLGLGPMVVDRLLQAVRAASLENGTAVLMVEQFVDKALDVSDRVYVMRRGRIVLSGTAESLRGRRDEIEAHYLDEA
jgi:branched-chain amino acid transport system ATP-binding protein